MLYKAYRDFKYSDKIANINLVINELRIYFKQHANNIIIKDDRFFTVHVDNSGLPVQSEKFFINNVFHGNFKDTDLLFIPKSFKIKYRTYIKYLKSIGKPMAFYRDDVSYNMWLIYLHNIVSKL